MNHYKVKLDGDIIRFTPDGKVAVVDVIKALSARDDAGRIWESLKKQCPELKEICESYKFKKDESDCVVTSEIWQIIEDALYSYMISHTPSA
jgi:hypothetical protein